MSPVLPKWDQRYLKLAKYWALECSKDYSTKVGCVLVRPDNTIASIAYNGYPPGIKDTEERLNDKEFKKAVVKHAEDNALAFCNDERVNGYSLYVWPCIPCSVCASSIIRDRIARVICPNLVKTNGGTDLSLTLELFKEAGVEITYGEA
jgi:dCMP deaminase